MDIGHLRDMVIRGIEQAELSCAEIKKVENSNSMFQLETEDKSQFLIKILKTEKEIDSVIQEVNDNYNRINSIYNIFSQTCECNEILMKNKLNIGWIEKKLENKEYCQLENDILRYASKNDELVFTLGFKYAWSLFSECVKR